MTTWPRQSVSLSGLSIHASADDLGSEPADGQFSMRGQPGLGDFTNGPLIGRVGRQELDVGKLEQHSFVQVLRFHNHRLDIAAVQIVEQRLIVVVFKAHGHLRILGAIPRELGAKGEHLGQCQAGMPLRRMVRVPEEAPRVGAVRPLHW